LRPEYVDLGHINTDLEWQCYFECEI